MPVRDFGPWRGHGVPSSLRAVTYFFRVLECEDGSWACRWGRREFDRHRQRDEALDHITAIAGEHRPSEVLVHHLDGRLHCVATFEADGDVGGYEASDA